MIPTRRLGLRLATALPAVAILCFGAEGVARTGRQLEIVCTDPAIGGAIARSALQQHEGPVSLVDAVAPPAADAWRLFIEIRGEGLTALRLRDDEGHSVSRTLSVDVSSGAFDHAEAIALEIPSMLAEVERLRRVEMPPIPAPTPAVASAEIAPIRPPLLPAPVAPVDWGPGPRGGERTIESREQLLHTSVYAGVWSAPATVSVAGSSIALDLGFARGLSARIGVGFYPVEVERQARLPSVQFMPVETLVGTRLGRGRLSISMFAGGSVVLGFAPRQQDVLTAYSADLTLGWKIGARTEIVARASSTYASGATRSTGGQAGQISFPDFFVLSSMGLERAW